VTLQVLTIGRALIEDRKDWVQRRYETRDGRRCAVGALRGAARLMNLHGPQSGANTILLSVAMSRGFNDIESMNDNSSHRQVISAFDEAIGRARARPQVPDGVIPAARRADWYARRVGGCAQNQYARRVGVAAARKINKTLGARLLTKSGCFGRLMLPRLAVVHHGPPCAA